MPPVYPASAYSAALPLAPPRPALAGRHKADVCVIGGGYTGLSAALALAERGYDVVLLEAARVGFGASGRNGGQLLPGLARSLSGYANHLGHERARALWDLSVAAVDLVKARIARFRIDCDLASGALLAAAKPRHLDGLKAERDYVAGRLGYADLRLLDRDEVRRAVASPRFHGGLLDLRGGHLQPLAYALGLAGAAEQAGARIFEDSRVLRLLPGPQSGSGPSSGPRALTAQGEVEARHLLLCTNAYGGDLAPRLKPYIMPVASFILSTAPLGPERARALIRENWCVCDTNFVLDYFRLSADHRLLFGGRVSYANTTPRRLAASMRRRMLHSFPQLADAEIGPVWGGLVDISRNRLPHVGRLAPEIYFAQGFSGHGVALSGLVGQVLAEAVAGTAERFDLFARLPHKPFPGGRLLRMPLLLLVTLYSRLRDYL